MVKPDYSNFQQCGRFRLSDGTELIGDLKLKRSDTELKLYSQEPMPYPHHEDISGELGDQTSVSLINCISTGGPAVSSQGDYWRSIYPHVICFGDHHLTSDEEVVRSIQFSIEDGTEIFNHAAETGFVPWFTLANDGDRREAFRQLTGEEPQDSATMMYYNGNPMHVENLTTDAGIISVRKVLTVHPSLQITGRVRIKFEPDQQASLKNLLDYISVIRVFFELVAGRPQNCTDIEIKTNRSDRWVDVYKCKDLNRRNNCEDKLMASDLSLDFSADSDEFNETMSRWLNNHAAREQARSSYLEHMSERSNYNEDRLIRAANAFDQLPNDLYPAEVEIDQELADAKAQARALFRALPDSPERSSVLGALGRIGRFSLKRKVTYRAEIVVNLLPEQFPKLIMVTDTAVDARNRFVHGHNSVVLRDEGRRVELDNQQIYEHFTFLARTLEFIFIASDLIDSGWKIEEWFPKLQTGVHPFRQFVNNYEQELLRLEQLLPLP